MGESVCDGWVEVEVWEEVGLDMRPQHGQVPLPSDVSRDDASPLRLMTSRPSRHQKDPAKAGPVEGLELSTGVSVLATCGDRAGRVACRG